MRADHSDHFPPPIPQDHRFTPEKYSVKIYASIKLLLVLSTLLLRTASTQAAPEAPQLTPDPLIGFMIDQVDTDRLYQLTGEFSGEQPVMIGGQPYTILTRNSFSGEPIDKASQYLHQFYQGLGLQVSSDEFDFFDRTLTNVVAEKPGSLHPEQVYLLTSHYDNAPGGPRAPGADDNASGTVAVMLAAEVLTRYDFGCSLRFVHFAGEEYGLEGSQAYVEELFNAGEQLGGIINLDMIAWNEPGSQPDMDLHAKQGIDGTLELAGLFQQVIAAYNLDLEPQIIADGSGASDHASFWTYDYPAILAIEDLDDFNPFYHSTNDTVANLDDQTYFTEMAKASLATLAHLGCLVEPGWGVLSGQVEDLLTGEPIDRAVISLHQPGWGYTRSVLTDENGQFKVDLPATIHKLDADAPGYTSVNDLQVSIPENQEINIELRLTPALEYSGYFPLTHHSSTPRPDSR